MLEVGITYNPRRHDQCVSFFLFLGLLSSPLLEKKNASTIFFCCLKIYILKNIRKSKNSRNLIKILELKMM